VSSGSCCLLDSGHYGQIYICVYRNTNIHIYQCVYVYINSFFIGWCCLKVFLLSAGLRALLTGTDMRIYIYKHMCVAVCCSVLQCIAMCCSVLQRTPCTFNRYRYAYIHIKTYVYRYVYVYINCVFGGWCCVQLFVLSAGLSIGEGEWGGGGGRRSAHTHTHTHIYTHTIAHTHTRTHIRDTIW